MKQNFSKLFAALLVAMLVSVNVQAEVITGSCGTNLTYELDTDDGILTISGTGAMTSTPWSEYASQIRTINLPEGLSFITQDAFKNCDIDKINIPSTVSSIHYMAFNNCANLSKITVAEGNTTYDSRDNCNAIVETATNTIVVGCMSTTFPSSVTTIGRYAFYGSGISTLKITTNSLTEIMTYAFSHCENLQSVQLPASVTTIGTYAFSSCTSLKNFTLDGDATFTTIPESIFYQCTALEKAVFPRTVTEIGQSAFNGCTSLTDVGEDLNRYDNVQTIGADAFQDCTALTHLTFPALQSVGQGAFHRCSSLQGVTAELHNLPNFVFNGCTVLNEITIGNDVTEVGIRAFMGCKALKTIIFDSGLTSIGQWAFRESGLTSAFIPESVTTIGDGAFWLCDSLTDVTCGAMNPVTIGSTTFISINASCKLTVPFGTAEAYEAAGWTSARFKGGVSATGAVKVDNLYYLIDASTHTATVTSAGPSLTGVASEPSGLVVRLRGYTGDIVIPSSIKYQDQPYYVTAINEKAFDLDYVREGSMNVTIPASISSIGNHAFSYCRINTMRVLAITPPTLESYTSLGGTGNVQQILVPVGLEDVYKSASVWSQYESKIFGADLSSIGQTVRENHVFMLGGSGATAVLNWTDEDGNAHSEELPILEVFRVALNDSCQVSLSITVDDEHEFSGLFRNGYDYQGVYDYEENDSTITFTLNDERVSLEGDDVTWYINILMKPDNSDDDETNIGDVNQDGELTIADVTALVNIVLGKAVAPGPLSDVTLDYDVTLKPDANYTPYYIPLSMKVCNALQLTASQIASKLLTTLAEPQNGEVELVSYDDGGVSTLGYNVVSSGGEIGYWYDADGDAINWGDSSKLAVYFDTNKQKYVVLLHPNTSTGCAVTVKQALIYKDDSGQTATATVNFHIAVDETAENAATLR